MVAHASPELLPFRHKDRDEEPLFRRRALALGKRLARSIVRARPDERRVVLIFGCQRSGTIRRYPEVAQSNVHRFGMGNPYRDLQPIRSRDPLDWRYEGTTEGTWETVTTLMNRRLTPFDAAALFWWTRNRLYFDQRLWADDRIRILRYERACHQPDQVIRSLSDHIGLALPLGSIARRVRARPFPPERRELDPDVERLCRKLWDSFEGCPEL